MTSVKPFDSTKKTQKMTFFLIKSGTFSNCFSKLLLRETFVRILIQTPILLQTEVNVKGLFYLSNAYRAVLYTNADSIELEIAD
jgi:hypothetical protein